MTPMKQLRLFLAAAAAALCASALPAPAEAASYLTQAACGVNPADPDPCAIVPSDGPAVTTLRTITFTTSRANQQAIVTFQGGLYCASGDVAAVVDLVSGLTTRPNEKPDLGTPGSMRHAHVYTGNDSSTFNLNTTRGLTFGNAGQQTLYFKMRRSRMDPGSICFTNNNYFVITLLP